MNTLQPFLFIGIPLVAPKEVNNVINRPKMPLYRYLLALIDDVRLAAGSSY